MGTLWFQQRMGILMLVNDNCKYYSSRNKSTWTINVCFLGVFFKENTLCPINISNHFCIVYDHCNNYYLNVIVLNGLFFNLFYLIIQCFPLGTKSYLHCAIARPSKYRLYSAIANRPQTGKSPLSALIITFLFLK